MVAVILNPKAHGGTGLRRWRRFLASKEGSVFRSSPCFSGELESLNSWIRNQYSQGVREFIAAGGDGTVHLVLNRFFELGMSSDVRLGAVGIGSSNDFHKPFLSDGRKKIAGLPCRIDFSRAKPADMGRVTTDESGHPIYFVVNSSIGVTADANLRFNRARGIFGFLKKNWTDGAIIAAALKTFSEYDNQQIVLRAEDESARTLNVTNLGLVKSRFFSGSFRYEEGPSVPAINDGMLGLFLCHDMGKGEMLRMLLSLSRGKFTGLPKTESRRIRECEITSPTGKRFTVETDGEVSLATRARYDVSREAVLLCP